MSDNIGVRVTGDVTDLQRALAQGGASVKQFSQQTGRDMDHVGDKAKQTGERVNFLAGILSLLSVKVAAGFGWKAATGELTRFESAMVDATTSAQKLRNTLSFAVGKDSAARDMAFLRETTRTLGLEFISTSQQYARLAAASRGTNMEGNNTRELFEAIAQASTVMGMSVEETEGALRAVQQMMSKGKVQAEELRGQLGERLPGAFHIAARSMGVTTGQLDKMLETGAVVADEFLPRFAAQLKKELGGASVEAAQSAQAATNRFTNAYTEFKTALADTGVYDLVARRQAVAAASFGTMAEAMREAKAEGQGFFGQLFSAFGADISLTNPLTGISMSAKENAVRLKEARERLQELQAQSEVLGNNIYWKAERAEITDYIARLEKALGLKKQLTANEQGAIASGEAIRAQYPTRSQNYEEHARREAQSRASLDSIKQRLSGQGEAYQRTLQELYRLYVNGTIKTTEEYRRYVTELIAREGGIKKGDKKANPADAVFKSISERSAELRQEITLEQNLTAAQKLASKVLDDMRTGTLKLTEAEKGRMGLSLRDLLTQDQANTQREAATKLQAENARIIEKNTEAAERASEQRIKALEGEIQSNDKLREEIALIGLGDDARTRRLQLIEQEAIARLELDLVMARNIEGNEAEASAIEREIKLRRDRVGLLGKKGEAEAFAKIEEEGAKAAEDIRGNLTDALMRGFEDGKDLAENFRDTLKNMTFTLGIRPVTQAMATPIANGISSLFGGGVASAAGTGAVQGGMSSLGGSAIGSAIMGGAGAFGSGVMSGLTAWGAGGSVTGLLGTGSAMFSGGLMSGLGTIAGALGPIALGIGLLVSYFKGRGETRVGGQYQGTSLIDSPSGGEIGGEQIRQTIATTIDGINTTLDRLGSSASVNLFRSGLEQSEKGKGFAYARGTLSTGAQFGDWSVDGYMQNRGSMTAEEAAKKFGQELKQATLEALQAADVPGQLGAWLRSLGDIDALSEGALDAALARLDKALGEKASLEDRYFELTHSAAEVLARDRQRERDALDESNRELYDRITALQDEQAATEAATQAHRALIETLAGDLDAATRALADARRAETDRIKDGIAVLESSASRFRSFASDIRTFRDSLLLGDLSPLTPAQRYAEARRIAEDTYSRALTGDRDAMEQIPQVARDFLEASQVYNASSTAYQRDFAVVQGYLLVGAEKADEAAAWSEAQAAIANAQLSALGMINASVLTVAQAIANLRTAGAAVLGAGGAVGDAPLSEYLSALYGQGRYMEGIEALSATGRTMAQGDELLGFGAGTIEQWARGNGVPVFHEGTPYVPRTGLAVLQQGERVTSRGGNDALLTELQQLRAEVAALRADHRQGVVSRNTTTIEGARFTVNGLTEGSRRLAFERQNAQEAQQPR